MNCGICDAYFAFRVKLRRHIKTEQTPVYVMLILHLELSKEDILRRSGAIYVMLILNLKLS